METINNLVREIAVIVLLATFLEMMLPKSSMRRFVQVVLGLFILIAILNPVANLLTSDETTFQFEAWQYRPEAREHQLEEILAQGQQLYQTAEQASVREYEMRLEKQMESLVQLVPGVDKPEIDVRVGQGRTGTYGEIQQVVVRLQAEPKPQQELVGVESGLEPIEIHELKQVMINIEEKDSAEEELQQLTTQELKQQQQDIITLIGNFYGMPAGRIEVIN